MDWAENTDITTFIGFFWLLSIENFKEYITLKADNWQDSNGHFFSDMGPTLFITHKYNYYIIYTQSSFCNV